MKKVITLFLMLLFVSTMGYTQTVNFESYQNLTVSKPATFQNSSINFDEAFLGVRKTVDKFEFGTIVVLSNNTPGDYALNLHSAYVSYSDKIFTDWDYKVTGGKFVNNWFNQTYDRNYTFEKNLIVAYPEFNLNKYQTSTAQKDFTDPGIELSLADQNGAQLNVALFDTKNNNKSLFTTLTYTNENFTAGAFINTLVGDSLSKPLVFGGNLKYYTQISKNPIAGGIEGIYRTDKIADITYNQYITAVWGQFGLKTLPNWKLYTNWQVLVPYTEVKQNNTKGSLFVTYTPSNYFNMGLGYTYFWKNVTVPTNFMWTSSAKEYYEISLKTGFNF